MSNEKPDIKSFTLVLVNGVFQASGNMEPQEVFPVIFKMIIDSEKVKAVEEFKKMTVQKDETKL